eukprot:g6238.t1
MSRKALWFSVFALVGILAQGETTVKDFTGVWQSRFQSFSLNFFTDDGQGTLCRDTLSPECRDEITPIEETYTFNGTALAFMLRNRIGVTTRAESALLHPSCADDGVFPAERTFDIPETQNVLYDAEAGRMHFIDPRNPDIVNCVPMKIVAGENAPYLEVTHTVSVLFVVGQPVPIVQFLCDPFPLPCLIEVNDNGNVKVEADVSINMTCIAGDCLTAFEASVPLASHTLIESEDDV